MKNKKQTMKTLKNSRDLHERASKKNVFGLNCTIYKRMREGKQQICEIGKIGLQKQDYSE